MNAEEQRRHIEALEQSIAESRSAIESLRQAIDRIDASLKRIKLLNLPGSECPPAQVSSLPLHQDPRILEFLQRCQ